MNADFLKRIIRAIADASQEDLDRLARKVVETERESGHTRLAGELEAILEHGSRPSNGRSGGPEPDRTLHELPLSRRHRELLLTLIPRESLEHHMVLPPAIEARFARIEREYAARERLGVHGLRPRKKILLYGPPGCGKSLGAKRVAWNTGLPLLKVRFDALLSSYFGESLSNLRLIFDAAREQPAVLLLDECDFIARSRSSGKDVGEAARVANMLLQLMDDYDAPGLVIATTNLESLLDEALFRRFDDVFHVPLPGPQERSQLIRWALSGVNVSSGIPWEQLATDLENVSAAEIVKAAQNAAKAAVLAGKKVVEEEHICAAFAEIRPYKRDSSTE
jgi:SpoVK/Ycf46/Vps4 family AAA+-type ATPase